MFTSSVFSKSTFATEASIADAALEQLLACVSSHVHVKIGSPPARLAADTAFELTTFGVGTTEMLMEGGRGREGHVTLLTTRGAVVPVTDHVALEGREFVKWRITLVAAVSSLCQMQRLVMLQTVTSDERFPTQRTGKGFHLIVDEHVLL